MTRADELRRSLDGKAKPLGSLGRIEDLAVQLGTIQDTLRPRVTDPVVLVFAGDHGAVASGVSAYPSAVTAAMVRTYLAGRAAVNLFARGAGARVLVVDAGVAADLPAHPGLIDAKLGWGTQDWIHGPAMRTSDVALGFERAGGVVDHLADGGCTVLALGEMGIGNTASAALLAHKVAGLPLDTLVGRGAGLNDAGLAQKRALVAQGAARTVPLSLRERVGVRATASADVHACDSPHPDPLPRGEGEETLMPPLDALAEYGGFEVVMLAGAILRATERRVCVVIDGVIVTAAAIVAHALRPDCLAGCVFAHRSAESGHDAMLAHLGARPLLDLGMRLGEGSGAALAIPLLQAAAALLTDMADLKDVV